MNDETIVLTRMKPAKILELGNRIEKELEEVLTFYESNEFNQLTIDNKSLILTQMKALEIYLSVVTIKINNLIASEA